MIAAENGGKSTDLPFDSSRDQLASQLPTSEIHGTWFLGWLGAGRAVSETAHSGWAETFRRSSSWKQRTPSTCKGEDR
eukprot:scaffold8256_cov344-Pinguiococcus_pyrenoidosus.AAC.1